MVTANRPIPPKVFVEMEVEMAVHADGTDRNGALIIEGVVAAAAQGQISARCVDGAQKNGVPRKANACIARQSEVTKGGAVARVVNGVDGSIGSPT